MLLARAQRVRGLAEGDAVGLWQRLFGGNKSNPVEPSAVDVELVAGKLSARVVPHTITRATEPVPCWTYVTRGLPALGQKEFVFTLRRLPGETEPPGDPLNFFAQVHDLAAKGQVVDVGGYSCFRSPVGFLGRGDVVGLAYTSTEALDGVELPPADQALLAVLLAPEEAAVVGAIGTYRILALLGRANRYYPCPPWSDRQRPAVLTPADLAASLLSQVPTSYVRGATVRTFIHPVAPAQRAGDDRQGSLAGGEIVLRLPVSQRQPLREALARVPDEAALALLTDADPEANVRLVWRPGDEGIQTIIPTGSDGSCLTGGFVALIFGPTIQDGGRIVEDGFAVMLCPASWAKVREALSSGQPVRIAASGGGLMDFALDWLPPTGQRGDTPAAGGACFAVNELLLYQPDNVLQQRVASIEAWAQYLQRIEAVAADYWAGQPAGAGQTVTLVVAVKPGGRSRFWADFEPGGLDAEIERRFLQRLEEVPAPVVQQGPVATACHATLWGGKAAGWAFLPRQWQEACRQHGHGELLVPDGILALVWPD